MAGVIPKSINIDGVETLKDEEWHFVIDVNLHGIMYCMRSQLKNMNNGGSIVNASSLCGKNAMSAHHTSKYEWLTTHSRCNGISKERSVYSYQACRYWTEPISRKGSRSKLN
jgi:NAD(P)-dependent dehydrogenase (short-subunit alcohol dehydrogenase family)